MPQRAGDERIAVEEAATVELWLDVAQLYCSSKRCDEADVCIGAALALRPLAPDVIAAAARVAEARSRCDTACFAMF